MTKAELIKALEPFGDDQFIYVNMHSKSFPNGSQIQIQGVKTTPPWHCAAEDGSNHLIGLLVHAENKLL